MTAMMSGVKTDVGVIGVDEDIARGDCSTVAGNELVTSLEAAEIKGLSTGIISTARITHATPAATYAKSADRNWEDISDMPETAVTAGCVDIATQLIDFEQNLEQRFPGIDVDGIEVAFGGGRRHFYQKMKATTAPMPIVLLKAIAPIMSTLLPSGKHNMKTVNILSTKQVLMLLTPLTLSVY